MQMVPAQTSESLARRIWRVVRWFILGYVILLVILMYFENKLIYFPEPFAEGVDWKSTGLKFEDAWITTADGVKIHGWHFPCENPRARILFAHGNAGNITDREEIMRALQDRFQVEALFFDYRGYGRSEGSPNERGIQADARAARRWLADKAQIPESEIVLMGESIGCGVMVDLAAKDGARGLVLENAFSSLPDVAARAMPWIPVRLLMQTEFNSRGKIGDYHGPLLQFHGTRDSIIPFDLGKRLFDAANEPKTFVEIPRGDHNDPRTPLFYKELDLFLKNLPAEKK